MEDDYDSFDINDDLLYALMYEDREGRPVYWSCKHGWTGDLTKAWLLHLDEIEAVDNETDVNKLPAGKEVRKDAEWRPVYRPLPHDDNPLIKRR